jgi:carboxylesterase type B
VNTGNQQRICPQGATGWETFAEDFVISTLVGAPYNKTVPLQPDFTNITLPKADPRVSEDCLFLDVFVPENIFNKADGCDKAGAPVLVWIFGGGYVDGDKTASGSPSGLLARSEQPPNSGGVIYVAMNYRLGAFGFLAGKETIKHGVANAGLLDQRFALEWVQKYIYLFGGDPKRVTIFGESAGGGGVMHQLTVRFLVATKRCEY